MRKDDLQKEIELKYASGRKQIKQKNTKKKRVIVISLVADR